MTSSRRIIVPGPSGPQLPDLPGTPSGVICTSSHGFPVATCNKIYVGEVGSGDNFLITCVKNTSNNYGVITFYDYNLVEKTQHVFSYGSSYFTYISQPAPYGNGYAVAYAIGRRSGSGTSCLDGELLHSHWGFHFFDYWGHIGNVLWASDNTATLSGDLLGYNGDLFFGSSWTKGSVLGRWTDIRIWKYSSGGTLTGKRHRPEGLYFDKYAHLCQDNAGTFWLASYDQAGEVAITRFDSNLNRLGNTQGTGGFSCQESYGFAGITYNADGVWVGAGAGYKGGPWCGGRSHDLSASLSGYGNNSSWSSGTSAEGYGLSTFSANNRMLLSWYRAQVTDCYFTEHNAAGSLIRHGRETTGGSTVKSAAQAFYSNTVYTWTRNGTSYQITKTTAAQTWNPPCASESYSQTGSSTTFRGAVGGTYNNAGWTDLSVPGTGSTGVSTQGVSYPQTRCTN